MVCSRVRELREALSASTIASKSAAATRGSRRCKGAGTWLRAGLDPILDQRGADMVDVPGGASGLLVRIPRQCRAPRRATAVDWRDLRMWNRAVRGQFTIRRFIGPDLVGTLLAHLQFNAVRLAGSDLGRIRPTSVFRTIRELEDFALHCAV
jgi:hypothetical protein